MAGAPEGNKNAEKWTLRETVDIDIIDQYLNNGFKSEKEMCDYIDQYAQYFAQDVLEIKYINHKREYYLGAKVNFNYHGNLPRVDFMFEHNKGIILVECKNPTNTYAEIINGIGQLLAYYCICKNNDINVNRMCLVSSRYLHSVRQIINLFKLPIEYYMLTRDNILKLMN